MTHEAVAQIGGIGAVVSGLVTADAYAESVTRTILLGPLLTTDKPVNLRLGEGGRIVYSSLDAVGPPMWRRKFRPIERTYDVGIIYGNRRITDACTSRSVDAEVILVDVFHSNKDRLNLFKAELYKKFAIPSDRFENVWEYEQYVRLAEPGFEALKAIGCDGADEHVVILAHEYMGIPTALKAVLAGSPKTRTVFYAHEVASVRPIIEHLPGHDTMFYNLLAAASKDSRTLEQVFPSVFANFKHPLVKAARYCDHVFAVGDRIEDELRFIDPHFRTMDIDLVYNGIPAEGISLADRRNSRRRLLAYAENLFGSAPSWVFSHVCRPVLSKGIWRDLRVLHFMERILAKRGQQAVYFMLGTLAGQRRPVDVRQMERVYGWPVAHERGYPDLCGGEEILGDMFDHFNRKHKAIRAVLVNQWGWNRQLCGERMPEEVTFGDLRRGTDVEFGLSVYEPFGISQLEPLCFGAVCVVSNVCGCMGFARRAAGGAGLDDNIVEANFLRVPEGMTVEQLVGMPVRQRDAIESEEAGKVARRIVKLLAREDATIERRVRDGYEIAGRMSWENVVREYFLPSLGRAAGQK
ncbi:MAG: glycosyltransferase family protein [Planctomycetota bacterium]